MLRNILKRDELGDKACRGEVVDALVLTGGREQVAQVCRTRDTRAGATTSPVCYMQAVFSATRVVTGVAWG